MDVKVNNHKSWLGLSTLEASSDVARLGGCGLWSLPNVHRAYSECVLWSRVPFLTQLLGANPCAGNRANLQLCLAMERAMGLIKSKNLGQIGERGWQPLPWHVVRTPFSSGEGLRSSDSSNVRLWRLGWAPLRYWHAVQLCSMAARLLGYKSAELRSTG